MVPGMGYHGKRRGELRLPTSNPSHPPLPPYIFIIYMQAPGGSRGKLPQWGGGSPGSLSNSSPPPGTHRFLCSSGRLFSALQAPGPGKLPAGGFLILCPPSSALPAPVLCRPHPCFLGMQVPALPSPPLQHGGQSGFPSFRGPNLSRCFYLW